MQLQYQTARLKGAGSQTQQDGLSRVGWLRNLGMRQKLTLIALAFGLPLTVLIGVLVRNSVQAVNQNKRELYGLQKTVPLAEMQSGVYLFIDGVVNSDSKGLKQGVEQANAAIKTLKGQLSGRPAQRLDQVNSDWQGLQRGAQDKFTLLNNFQIFMQSNQQQLIEEMLVDAGLSAEADPALAAVVSANQRRLPQIITQLQLVAQYMYLLRQFPDERLNQQMANRNVIITESALNSYEADLKRAYSMQPELKDRVGKANAQFIGDVRSALNQAGNNLRYSQFDKPEVFTALSASLNHGRDAYKATAYTLADQLLARTKRDMMALLLNLAALGLMLAVAVYLLVSLSRSIVRPLRSLTSASEELTRGNLAVEVLVQSRDELGMMARTFNNAVSQLRSNQQKAEMERLETQQLQQNISQFLDVMMDIADGDLTKRGNVTGDVLGNVVDSINLMTDELSSTLVEVRSASHSVTEGSDSMLHSTDQIYQHTQVTTEETRRAARQARELNTNIAQMAAIAQATAESARRAQHASEQGQNAVQATLSGMRNIRSEVHTVSQGVKSLGDRSLQIQEIVDTIAHISSQVNLLSLHASLEAAGAGEAGTRFAVVAEEIRELADLSTAATANIAKLINEVQQQIQAVVVSVEEGSREVEQGFNVAQQAGDRLREISELTQVSAHFAQNISNATKTQVQSVQQMTGAVSQIASVAQQSQRAVEQGRQAAQQLQSLAQQLSTNLSRFRLPS